MSDPPAPAVAASPRGLDRLLELQQLDVSIDRLSGRIEALHAGGELREGRRAAADSESRLGEVRLSLDAVTRDQLRLEGDVDSLQRKTEAERTRLFDGSVANAKELQSIEAEVAGLRARISRLEDQLLELMEQREDLEGREREAAAALEASRGRLADLEQTAGQELLEAERSVERQRAERDRIAPSVDEDLLALYEDLRRQKRGVGAAALVDGVCQGCRQQLSPSYLQQLKRTAGIKRCEYCRRILVTG